MITQTIALSRFGLRLIAIHIHQYFTETLKSVQPGLGFFGGFRISPSARILNGVLILGVGISLLLGAINAVFYGAYGSGLQALPHELFNILLCPSAIFVFFAFLRHFLGRNDENYIRKFLAQTFDP